MKKTYTLNELVHLNIDSWVEAMAWLDDNYIDECIKKYASEEEVFKWRNLCGCCPACLEEGFTELSNEHGFRYYADGTVANDNGV